MGGWRLVTTVAIVLLIQIYHSPPTGLEKKLHEVTTPRTGRHPMHYEL